MHNSIYFIYILFFQEDNIPFSLSFVLRQGLENFNFLVHFSREEFWRKEGLMNVKTDTEEGGGGGGGGGGGKERRKDGNGRDRFYGRDCI